MKQIYLHILAVALPSLTLTACGNDDIFPDTEVVAPSFTANINTGNSRAYDSIWEPGDEIGISTSLTPNTSNVYNVCYITPAADGVFTVKVIEDEILFRTTNRTNNVTFYAYYPYVYIPNASSTRQQLDVNTSEQTNQKNFDLLFASAKGTKNSPEVTFTFEHKMSMVTFVFKNGKDFDVSNISCYQLGDLNLTAKFNITTGGFSSLATKSSVKLDASNVKEGKPVDPFILLPQTLSTQTPLQLRVITSDNQVFSVNLTFPSNKLTAGINYKFTVTVNKTGLAVNNCTIENWTIKKDTGWGTGSADSSDDPEEEL